MYGCIDIDVSVRSSAPVTHIEQLHEAIIGKCIKSNVFETSIWNGISGDPYISTDIYVTFSSSDMATGRIDSYRGQYSYLDGSTLIVTTTTFFPDITFTIEKL